MMKEWISPIIETQTNILVDNITLNNEKDQPYNNLSEFIQNLKISTDTVFELENLIIEHTISAVKYSYSKGLFDGAKYLK